MKRWKRVVLGALAALLIAGAIFVVPTIWGKPWSIQHFYARVFLSFMLDHPELLSSMRILEPMGFEFHNADLSDRSVEGTRRDLETARDNLETLRRYDRSKLEDPLSYDVLELFLADAVADQEFAFHGYPVNQLGGFQSNLPDFMINTHRIDHRKGAENYLARLAKFDVAFDQTLESIRYREQLGIVPPRFVMTHVLTEMREFIEPPIEEHPLYTHFRDSVAVLEDVSEEQEEKLLLRAGEIVEQVVYPSYRKMIEHYAELEPTASTDDGVWKLPEGDRFYAQQLRSYTTTEMTADEIHELGLELLEEIQVEMREILAAEGYPTDDLGATMKLLNREERFLYPDTNEGRQQILDDYQSIVEEIDAGMESFFSVRPAAGVVVDRVPEIKAETSTVAYYDPPPLDGSKPGTFYVNLRDVAEHPRFAMRTLAYHEAIPGHHFQIALAYELDDVPFFRRVIPFTAYVEGWALYSERVAAENGFQQDPYDRLGYLIAQAFRAARLVIDTGIHHKRWTREEAIEYMLASTGMPEREVVAEIERYIVDPGQACAYMVGQLEILRLRDEARQTLGERFDIRAFHEVVLRNGALPLTLLRREVEAWYKEG